MRSFKGRESLGGERERSIASEHKSSTDICFVALKVLGAMLRFEVHPVALYSLRMKHVTALASANVGIGERTACTSSLLRYTYGGCSVNARRALIKLQPLKRARVIGGRRLLRRVAEKEGRGLLDEACDASGVRIHSSVELTTKQKFWRKFQVKL